MVFVVFGRDVKQLFRDADTRSEIGFAQSLWLSLPNNVTSKVAEERTNTATRRDDDVTDECGEEEKEK